VHLTVLILSQLCVVICDLNMKLLCPLNNFLPLLWRYVMGNLCTVLFVVHHKQFKLRNVGDKEFKEPVGKSVTGSLIGTVTNLKITIVYSWLVRKSGSFTHCLYVYMKGWLTFTIGIVPLNLRRTDESIPFGLRQFEFLIRMKRLLKWRANFFDRFLIIFGLTIGVIFILLVRRSSLLFLL